MKAKKPKKPKKKRTIDKSTNARLAKFGEKVSRNVKNGNAQTNQLQRPKLIF